MPEDDGSRAAVEQEFATAERMLEDARLAQEVGISKATVVNRLYYACFHAAQAALYAHGYDPRTHDGVTTLFGRELVQNGALSREHGRFLSDMRTYRRRMDYGSSGIEPEPTDLLTGTERFLEAIRELIDE